MPDQVAEPTASVTDNGGYDRSGVYAAVHERHLEAAVAPPPHRDAVLSNMAETAPTQRDRHIQLIAETGWMTGQLTSGCNKRASVESQMARWEGVLDEGQRFHSNQARATEVAIGVLVLNRMNEPGCPNSVRVT